jgi:hypothetical protein
MRAMISYRVVGLLAVAVLSAIGSAVESQARGKASTAPGTYKEWNDVDEVTIVQPFQFTSYNRVVVLPFETKGAELPDQKDNSYEAVQKVLAASTSTFVQGLKEKLSGKTVEEGNAGGAGTLIIRARITQLAPGSQAARYFGGFGAGGATSGISGEIVDGANKKVLVRFAQERRSAVGRFGGGYEELLNRSLKQIGGDIAGMLKAF